MEQVVEEDVRGGLRVVEVPSVELKRRHGESKLSGIHTSLQMLRVILHELVSRA
jgi:hypothetical protein